MTMICHVQKNLKSTAKVSDNTNIRMNVAYWTQDIPVVIILTAFRLHKLLHKSKSKEHIWAKGSSFSISLEFQAHFRIHMGRKSG